jgi:hypothetical protein
MVLVQNINNYNQKSVAARLLGLRVRIPPGIWMSVSCECSVWCQVSASGSSLVQRSPTKCDVSECGREALTMRRPWPTSGCHAMFKQNWRRPRPPEYIPVHYTTAFCCKWALRNSAVAQLDEALRYGPERRAFDSRWGNFFIISIISLI